MAGITKSTSVSYASASGVKTAMLDFSRSSAGLSSGFSLHVYNGTNKQVAVVIEASLVKEGDADTDIKWAELHASSNLASGGSKLWTNQSSPVLYLRAKVTAPAGTTGDVRLNWLGC